MKTARFEFDELPFQTLARFGLTQEMIEDLPMRVLDELCEGRHSPVLPVRVSDENGKTVESRTRLVFYRMENGQVDVLFYPVLKSSPLDRYDREQQKQLLAGKAILADTPTEDGRHTKAFVQIDPETKQVMSVPTPIIGRNLQVLAEELHISFRTAARIVEKLEQNGYIVEVGRSVLNGRGRPTRVFQLLR